MSNFRAVILTALPVEFESVREFLPKSEEVCHPAGNIYERGEFQGNHCLWDVGIAEVGMGDAGAAFETERAISFFNPDVILFVGVAGGIKDVEIGDVVASTKVYNYESGKAKETFNPRPETGLSSYALIQRAMAERRSRGQEWLSRLKSKPQKLPKVKVGPIAAGEKVIASKKSEVYKLVEKQYGDALAVDMEGYGFLKAAHANEHRAVAMVVRGISDLIEGKNDEENQEPEDIRQEKASRHASAFAFQLLANFTPQGRLIEAPSEAQQVSPQPWDSLFNSFDNVDPERLQTFASCLEEVLPPLQRDLFPELSQKTTMNLKTLLSVVERLNSVERLDSVGLLVKWVELIVREPEERSDDELSGLGLSDLQAWCDKHRPSVREPEPEPEPERLEYLLITLEPRDDDDTVFLTAEIQATNGKLLSNNLLPPGQKCSIDDPSESLSEAINKAGKVKAVEIFLSWRHFRKPIHEWKINRGLDDIHLNVFRNVLLRSLDRCLEKKYKYLVAEWTERLRSQWEQLPSCENRVLEDYCHNVTALDLDFLRSTLVPEESKYLILHFLDELPEELDELRKLVSILMESGIPICLWPRDEPIQSESVPESLATLLCDMNVLRQPSRLAASIRKLDTPLSNLGLLCECPYRLPGLVDWKSGRLRQPA
ncbi:MAG: nucleoside phosphorylase [Cyanobacteria bacterium P01_F01_bin.150]